MENTLNVLGRFWPILALVVLVAAYKLVLRMFGMIIVAQDSVGIVNKKWVLFGKNKSLPDAQSSVKKAEGDAQSKNINAVADANVITTLGNAEAGKVKAIGTAEADVIKQKIESMEPGNYAGVQIANALATNKIKLVPDITVNSGTGGGGTIMDVFLATLLKNQVNGTTTK